VNSETVVDNRDADEAREQHTRRFESRAEVTEPSHMRNETLTGNSLFIAKDSVYQARGRSVFIVDYPLTQILVTCKSRGRVPLGQIVDMAFHAVIQFGLSNPSLKRTPSQRLCAPAAPVT
jgi:hypothetical protein